MSFDYADQRYYNPWFGRFNTPDPGGSGNPADPTSWNMYAYTGGDPINRVDPSGTDWCDIFPDAAACVIPNGFPCGFGYGTACGVSDYCASFFGGNPSFGFIADPLLALTCVSSAIPVLFAPQQAAASKPLVVTSLDITGDCWRAHNDKLGGAPSRDQQFTAFDGPMNLTGDNIVITEAVSTSPGGPLATQVIGDPGSRGSGGVFNDQKGLSFTQSGVVTLYQSFTVSVNGGASYSVPIVLANGTSVPYLTYTMSATFPSIWKTPPWRWFTENFDVVEYGKGKSSLPPGN